MADWPEATTWRAMRAPIASTSRLSSTSRACLACQRARGCWRSASSAPPNTHDVVTLYLARVAEGRLQRDEAQLRAAHELRKVQRRLLDYRPPASMLHLLDSMRDMTGKRTVEEPPDWLVPSDGAMTERERRKALVRVLSGEEELLNLETPTGFLLTGPPGTGKSQLMDLFFETLPTPHKTRRHYHHFLLSLYHQVFVSMNKTSAELDAEEAVAHANPSSAGYPWSRREEARAQAITRGWRSVFAGGRSLQDPHLQREFVLALIARDMIINDGWLLAFDEIQLVDVAGASILRRVLEHFWRLGGVVVGTSNRLPDDLYSKGIQREQFLIFLAILQNRCPVVELRANEDFRRLKQSASTKLDRPAKSWYLEQDRVGFEEAAGAALGLAGQPETITVYGRSLLVPLAAKGVARFHFKDLCDRPLGPADYISIASRYHTLIIDDVPVMPLAAKNEARRWITLIDSLYETRTKLIALAAAPIDEIVFPDGATAAKPAAAVFENDEVFMSARGGADHPLSPSRIYEGDAELLDTRNEDSVESEALTDMLRDLEAPYRPNISSYTEETAKTSAKESRSLVEPQIFKTPAMLDTIPAFRNLSIFSGEDERFAYARAVSRLCEMDSAEYILGARHQPLAENARSWERPVSQPVAAYSVEPGTPSRRMEEPRAEKGRKWDPLDEGIDPAALAPPKIASTHIWGMTENWGKRAGRWGRGVLAYATADKGKDGQK